MTKTTLPTKDHQWKSVASKISFPEDDRSYLVTWKKSDGGFSLPHLAYWNEEEGHFFSLESMHAQPLYVDLYIEIPDYPV